MRALAACVPALVLACTAAAAATPPVVVVDPGHDLRSNPSTEPIGPGSSTRKIKDGGGTRGVVTGTPEAELNLAVGLRLRALLERADVRVVMTRTRTAGTSFGNIRRARIANEAGAALFLRIHADGSPSPDARGTHILYPARIAGWTDDVYLASRRAARIVQSELLHALGFPDRGLQEHVRLHRLQLVERPGHPRGDGLHDQPDRGPACSTATRDAIAPRSDCVAGRFAS